MKATVGPPVRIWSYIRLPVIGLCTGLVNGLLGIGGGTLLVPALAFMIGVDEHRAHGTSLATILPTSAVSAYIYGTNQFLDWQLAWRVALGGTGGALLGAALMGRLSPFLLRRVYAVTIAVIGVRLVLAGFS